MTEPRLASEKKTVWMGLDVSKDSFAAAVDAPWTPGTPQTSLHHLEVRLFDRAQEGIGQAVAWARRQLADRGLGDHRLRVAMESTSSRLPTANPRCPKSPCAGSLRWPPLMITMMNSFSRPASASHATREFPSLRR